MQKGITTKVMINIALILITMIMGFILHKTGKPYNSALLTIHKLATLGFVIFISFVLVSYTGNYGLSVSFTAFLILAILSIIGLLVSGGMLSLDRMHFTMMWLHRIFAAGFVICIAVIFYKVLATYSQ
jgi:hypothetical protein